jgi:hypothetical protein
LFSILLASVVSLSQSGTANSDVDMMWIAESGRRSIDVEMVANGKARASARQGKARKHQPSDLL